jgi:hypothetical protein
MSKKKPAKRKAPAQWRVSRAGVRFAVTRRGKRLRGPDGEPRTFRTRDAAARVVRELSRGRR